MLSVNGYSKGKVKVMSVTDFETLVLGDAAIQIIDVRPPVEFNKGHIKGAKNMPYTNDDSVIEMINKIDKKLPVAVYCKSGAQSEAAANRLCKKGIKVYMLDRGIENWKKEGKKVIVD